MGNKHRRHEFLHIVAARALHEHAHLVVDTIGVPPGDLLTLPLEERQALPAVRCVPRPHLLEPTDERRHHERGELLRVLGARLGIGRDVLHSLTEGRGIVNGV